MHPLLRRQLLKAFGDDPPSDPRLAKLIEAVDAAYQGSDEDRVMVERSLELSSRELLTANSDLNGVLRCFPDLILRTTAEGRVLDVRGAAKSVLGHLPAVGESLEVVFGPQIGKSIGAAVGQSLADRQLITLDLRHDGNFLDVRVVPGLPGQAIVVCRDVSAVRAAELALGAQIEQRLRAERELEAITEQNRAFSRVLLALGSVEHGEVDSALEALLEESARALVVERVSFWQLSESGTHLQCRDAFRLGDDSHATCPPVRLADIPRYRERLESARTIAARCARTDPVVRELLAAGAVDPNVESTLDVPVRMNARVVGVVRHEHFHTLRDWSGGEEQFAASIADLVSLLLANHERIRLESQLRQTQKLDSLGLLAGGIAHDFNNLLAAIGSFASLVKEEVPPRSESAEDLEQIQHAVARGAELANKLLSFSRPRPPQKQVLQLNEVVSGFSAMLCRIVGEDIEVSIDTDPNLPLVEVDSSQIEQVVLNLTTNARQAMPRGGRLLLCTRALGRADDDLRVELSVSDTGQGMDEATRSRLFEPFFTTKQRGTGLGLSIVYGIVQQHGGVIVVDSAPGAGTTIRVRLPAAKGARPKSTATRSVPPRLEGTETVLVAEDEPSLRAVIRRSLEPLGYTVILAEDGLRAVEEFDRLEGRVDLALLDVVMPRLGGPEAYREMVQRRPELRVLFISGHAPEGAFAAVDAEASRQLLRKPFGRADLVRRVRLALDG